MLRKLRIFITKPFTILLWKAMHIEGRIGVLAYIGVYWLYSIISILCMPIVVFDFVLEVIKARSFIGGYNNIFNDNIAIIEDYANSKD